MSVLAQLLHNHKDVYVLSEKSTEVMLTLRLFFATFIGMSEGNISISAREKKFRVGVFSPTDWHAGMTKPSMVVELYPVFHRSTVSFVPTLVGDCPDVIDGWEPGYIADKVAAAVKAELEAEGETPNEDRAHDRTWILSTTEGYIRPGTEYRVVIWFVSECPGEISAIWVASADSVNRKTVTVNEPKGHMYRV